MNIAEQAYQDGQEYRKANGMQKAGEALENQAMEEFTHTGLDFQHWQLYHDNWMSGYRSVEDDPEQGRDVTSSDSLAILLSGQWIEGSIAHAADLYAIERAPQRVYSGIYFIDSSGNMCGLCSGMKVRLG